MKAAMMAAKNMTAYMPANMPARNFGGDIFEETFSDSENKAEF